MTQKLPCNEEMLAFFRDLNDIASGLTAQASTCIKGLLAEAYMKGWSAGRAARDAEHTPPVERARLDPDGTARPKTELAGVFVPGRMQPEAYVHRRAVPVCEHGTRGCGGRGDKHACEGGGRGTP